MQRDRSDALFLGAHDAFERGVARLAEGERGGEQRRKRTVNRLIARVGFALDFDRVPFDFNLTGVGDAWQAEMLGERTRNGAGAAVVGKTADNE